MKHNTPEGISLSALNRRIRGTLEESFPEEIWVAAEISEIKYRTSGHCYLELIEKEENSDKLAAKARAVIWSRTFSMLRPYFESTTGYELEAGIKVLIRVQVNFHELYGFSLVITDIDPAYTLGDVAKKRMQVIQRLTEDGVINMNKELSLPLVPQRIAIISSDTAAGYGDFINQLDNNPFGYHFDWKLYPSIMQGDQAPSSIINTLGSIFEQEDLFDAVVLIRGGGSKSDLSCFDDYDLNFHLAQFPLPVLTGIGHEQDDTIADMVANRKLKTPTAVAEFLISSLNEYENILLNCQERFILRVNSLMQEHKSTLDLLQQQLSASTREMLNGQKEILARQVSSLSYSVRNYFNMSRAVLDKYGEVNKRLDPANILKLGYSITSFNGRVLTDARRVTGGDVIKTKLKKGEINSTVHENND